MSARILVVDDNATNLELMLYLLRAFGHTVKGANDGLAGLEEATTGAYDLVLCDILMPGIDGYEFARRVKGESRTQNVRLVAVTALAMVGDRERILSAGFDGYIAKPIDPESFVMRVDAFLPEEWRSVASRNVRSASPQSAQNVSSGPVILAVDDVQVNLDVMGGALRPFGFVVVEATNVEDAYHRARERKPAIILCDVHMKGGDGFDLIQKIKADPELQDVPFLFVSSTAWRTSDHNRGLELGAEKFLLRPIEPAQLLEEIERALRDSEDGEDTGRG